MDTNKKDIKKNVNDVDQEISAARVDDVVDVHQSMIAEAAYYKAESRGFAPGHEMEDWLKAENDIMNNSYSP
jgi:hypothetical protein